jgi:hypothetical protein
MNWVNPRSFTTPVAFASQRTLVWNHNPSCANLKNLLNSAREKTALERRADSAKLAYKNFRIPGLRYYPTDSLSGQIALHSNKKNRLEGKFDKPCKGIFCKLDKLFEGRKAKQERTEGLAVAAELKTTIDELQIKLEHNRALKAANRLEIDSFVLVQRRMKDRYLALKQAVRKERNTTVQTAVFEKTYCGLQHYRKMPEALRPHADAAPELALYYYQEDFKALSVEYPEHETLISQHLYNQPTYALASKEKRFQTLKEKRNIKALEQLYPEREAEVCQELYKVSTYAEAKRKRLFDRYYEEQNLEGLEVNFPEREREVCRRLYNVDTYAEAKQEKRERVFMRYCQAYDLEGLERDFKDREREVCLLLYAVPTFEEAKLEKGRRDRIDKLYYSLQLSNKSLGRWMNLDYLRKLPKEELLVQTVRVKAPLMRQDFLIYRDTKAMAQPSRRSSSQTQYKDVVHKEAHTLVSYYAIDDEHVALAVRDFKALRGVELELTYERLTLEDFANRLAEFN